VVPQRVTRTHDQGQRDRLDLNPEVRGDANRSVDRDEVQPREPQTDLAPLLIVIGVGVILVVARVIMMIPAVPAMRDR
jgi:hypothetical protein